MNLNLVALATAAAASIALAIAVYQRTPDRVWNRLFALHATVIGLWAFCNFFIMTAETAAHAGIFLRLSHPLAALTACTVIDFVWVFPERIDYAPKRRRLLLYSVGLAFGTVGMAPNLYESIELIGGLVNVTYGWPLIPFGAFIVIAMGYADIILLRKAFRLEGVQRVQVFWVLIGFAGTHLAGVITIIVIPLVWGTTAYSGWGAVGVLSQLLGMSYAIVRHRLMRPSIAFGRLTVAAASAVIVVAIGSAALRLITPLVRQVGLSISASYLVIGILMGAGVTLVHRWISNIVHVQETDPASVHVETSTQILRTLDSENLLQLLAHALDDALKPSVVVVYTLAQGRRELRPRVVHRASGDASVNGQAAVSLDHRALDLVRDGSLLTRDQVFRFASIERARQISSAMDEWEAQIVAPLIWEDDLIGLVSLGPRRSGEMYSDDDLRFVADVALQASLAMRNADLYAETASLKEFNERILRQMDNAVIVTDDEETIVVFNSAAEKMFGIPGHKARGESIDILPMAIASCIRASLRTGRVLPSRHFEIERGDEVVPLACSTSPLESDGDARPQGAVAVISDLTLIRELDREREEAERLLLIREISAGMAHEIRNPLVAIRTFAELAPSRLDDPEFRSNFLTVVREEIMRIDKLVGDLLTLSKPADAVVEKIEVEPVCRGVMRAMAGVAESREVTLNLELDERHELLEGDETRLYQALLNLVSNAIDAEPEGGSVTLKTQVYDGPRGDRRFCISVHNPASFIPEEQTEDIWRPFVSRKPTGTGLGLAICKTIIEEHNGYVSVESTVDGGTTFVVELPLPSRTTAVTSGEF